MRKELIVKEDPKSPISEIFRTLRTNIQFMNNRNKLQSLLVTSTLPGEGKSWISANLAVTFAQAGKRVIVLDADMRKGRQYRIFGISPRPGLSNYLSGVTDDGKEVDLADYIQETEVENLYVIPAGNVPPNPSELLVSESMLDLLDELKEICDILIIDGPPTQLVTDSLILARIADSTVIVAESNHTKKESLRRIVDNIQKVGGKIAGVVINKMQLSARKYEQSYYYGSTAMTLKNKHGKRTVNKKEDVQELRHRNTKRARELVNQNREKEEIKEQDKIVTFEDNNVTKKIEQVQEKVQEKVQEQELPEFLKNRAKENETENQSNNVESVYSFYGLNDENIEKQSASNIYEDTLGTDGDSYTEEILDDSINDILQQVNDYLEQEKRN